MQDPPTAEHARPVVEVRTIDLDSASKEDMIEFLIEVLGFERTLVQYFDIPALRSTIRKHSIP